MNSRARIVLIIIISLAVPVIGVWQRWSEIRAFARELQADLASGPNANTLTPGAPGVQFNGREYVAVEADPVSWQAKMEQALAAGGDPAATGRKILEVFPNLSETGKAEAVRHLTHLVSDEEYASLGQMLANPDSPSTVTDTLMADVLNRRDSIKLPALLEVARTANHAKAQEAKAILLPYVREDLGENWAKYQDKINLWLKNHPES